MEKPVPGPGHHKATYTKADLDQFSSTLPRHDQEWFDTLKDQLVGQEKPVPVPAYPTGATFTNADLDRFCSKLDDYNREWFDEYWKQKVLGQQVPQPSDLAWAFVARYDINTWKDMLLEEYLNG